MKDIKKTSKRNADAEIDFAVRYSNPEMKQEMAERIRKCADIVGSGDALAQKAAIPRRTLETYLSGNSEPKALTAAKISRAAGVTLDWMVTGEGDKQLATAPERSAQDELDQIEGLLESEAPIAPDKLVVRGDLSTAKLALMRISGDQQVREKDRNRADLLLHLAFGDTEAARRSDARFESVTERLRAATALVEQLVDEAGFETAAPLRTALVSAVYRDGLSEKSVAELLAACAPE